MELQSFDARRVAHVASGRVMWWTKEVLGGVFFVEAYRLEPAG